MEKRKNNSYWNAITRKPAKPGIPPSVQFKDRAKKYYLHPNERMAFHPRYFKTPPKGLKLVDLDSLKKERFKQRFGNPNEE